MIKEAKIEIEQFDNGITARWEDADGNYDPTKSLAEKGKEAECIGKEIWGDVREILSTQPTDKVIIKVQYVIPE
jgi:hypothetical protein